MARYLTLHGVDSRQKTVEDGEDEPGDGDKGGDEPGDGDKGGAPQDPPAPKRRRTTPATGEVSARAWDTRPDNEIHPSYEAVLSRMLVRNRDKDAKLQRRQNKNLAFGRFI